MKIGPLSLSESGESKTLIQVGMCSFPLGVLNSKCLRILLLFAYATMFATTELAAEFPLDPEQTLERTCFQTDASWSDIANLRSDVAIVYGVDADLPARIQTWRDRGYRIH